MFIVVGHAIFTDSHQFFDEGINLVGTTETLLEAVDLIEAYAKEYGEVLDWSRFDTPLGKNNQRVVGCTDDNDLDDDESMSGYIIWEV